MVRAGAVKHPSEWTFCGYNEIQAPPQRYTLIDRKLLMTLLGIHNSKKFSETYNGWVAFVLKRGSNDREDKWMQSIAAGGKEFIERVKDRLGCKAIGRKVSETDGDFELKENVLPYRVGFTG